MAQFQYILDRLPYQSPFLFVDSLSYVSADRVEGSYCFKADSDFYKGHFKDNPVTPGVLLTECMAQIGLVCMGIFLLSEGETRISSEKMQAGIAMSSSEVDFYKVVLPGEIVTVISEKMYFRFRKLKCKVKMTNDAGEIVCKGTISGMISSI